MNDPESIYIHHYIAALERLGKLLKASDADMPAASRLKRALDQLQSAHLALGNEPASVPLPPDVAEEARRLADRFYRATQGTLHDRAVDAAEELASGWSGLPGYTGVPTRGVLRRLDILGRWPAPDQPAPEKEDERDARGGSHDDRPVTRG